MHRAYIYAEWTDIGWGFKWCYVTIVNQFMFVSMED
jgi:hypothetical protein